MSTPWLFGVPAGLPVEIVCGCENEAPPSVEVLNTIGEAPEAWKFVCAT